MGEVKHDGGPAFPTIHGYVDSFGSLRQKSEGLSIRDWFAGQALAGICANSAWNDTFHQYIMKPSAEAAYAMADAMIAARAESLPLSTEGEEGR